MRLAILGTRGVPPAYGGFETFAAELGRRLVSRGHEVTVYCRRPSPGASRHPLPAGGARVLGKSLLPAARGEGARRADEGRVFCAVPSPGAPRHPLPASGARVLGGSSWEGIRRIVLPAVGHKYWETVSHTFLSALDALRRDFDAVLLCNAANAFVLPLLRAARLPVAINVDGIERKRRKWNALGRAVYAIGESFSVVFANAVVADAEVIADYYRRQYSIEPVMIPYGADFPIEDDSDVLERLGIKGEYILYVSRFEPENNPLEVVLAYEKLTDAPPLVMLGSGLYAPELVAELRRHASPKVLFPGALYGADYRMLQRNALLYIQATEVGGTHPAMIEAMASNGAVLAHDTPENREVGGDAVGYFRLRPEETLSGMLREWLRGVPDRERARQRAAERFSWNAVTDRYEELFRNLVSS